MVDFELAKEVRETQRLVHAFAQGRLRPIAREFDRNEHAIPWDLIREVHRMQASMPVKRGTATPGGTLAAAVLAEEMAWGDPGLMRMLPGPGLGGAAIMANGTPEQVERFLKRYSGPEPAFGAMAMTEPGAGSDTAAVRTTAHREGDHWVLNGEKFFCSNAQMAIEKTEGLMVVWAKVVEKGASPDQTTRAAMRPFVIPAGTPGARIAKVEKKLGIRASNTCDVVLEDCRVPLDHILPWPEDTSKAKGFKGAMAAFDTMRPIVAAAGIGCARAALEVTRELFRRAGQPIRYGLSPAQMTAAERDFIEAETKLQAARLLAWRACWMADHKLPNNAEASMSKAMAGTVVAQVTQKCVELAGALGYSERELLEKWLRDAKVTNIAEGTGEIQRLIIARRILGYTREQLK
jgi:acyl-CoA dehydrogenase